MNTLKIVLVAICLWTLAASSGFAQSKEEAVVRESFAVFVNPQATVEERTLAASEFGVATRPDDMERLIHVAGDKSQPEAIRVIALNKMSSTQIDGQIKLFERILSDKEESSRFRVAACERLHILTEFTYGGGESRDRLLGLMREQIESPDQNVRRCAMSYLATAGDPVAVTTLTEQLAAGDTKLFAADESITYLTLNAPQAHFNAIRPYIDAKDEKTLTAAVRALGQDPESLGKIREYFQSKEPSATVRSTASKVLARYDKDYPSYALEIVDDEGEGARLRAQIIMDLGTGVKSSVYSDQYKKQIEAAIENIDTETPLLKNAIGEFQELQQQSSKASSD